MAKQKISDRQPGELSQFLLNLHSHGGVYRHEDDFNEAKDHTKTTLANMIDFLENFEDSVEDKVRYLKNELNVELNKFKVK